MKILNLFIYRNAIKLLTKFQTMKKSLVILSVFAMGISYAQKTTEIPVFKSDKEKSEWIQQNPELYNQPTKEREFTSVEEKRSFNADPIRERVIFADDSSFPTYVRTGNKRLDDETYAAKKAKWIEQNAAKYEKLSSVHDESEEEALRAKKMALRSKEKESNNPKN